METLCLASCGAVNTTLHDMFGQTPPPPYSVAGGDLGQGSRLRVQQFGQTATALYSVARDDDIVQK